MTSRIVATLITLLLAFCIIHAVHAGEKHDNGRHDPHKSVVITKAPDPTPPITNITEAVTNVTEEHYSNKYITQYYVDNDLYNAGIATSYASSQHQFDFGSELLQGSVAAASYGGEVAGDFAIGKVYRGVLFNGSIGKAASGHTAVGGAINWRFQ